MTQTQSNDLSSRVRGVDVAAIERELAALREGEAEEGLTRVCVANLVVFAPAGEDRAALDALLEEVAAHTPCRVVVVRADRSAAAGLEANASARCHVGLKGRRQVCAEQVTLDAGGAAVETAASAVEPLLVPDVPAFLWWKDVPHYDDKLFARLVEMSDRVVIDSAAFDHPHADLRRVAALVEGRREAMRLTDLNWGRLTKWRDLVADFWDVPDYRAHLDTLDSVRIEYAPATHAPAETPAQPLLFAGWLASCLGWHAREPCTRDGEGRRATLDAGGREIGLELRAAETRAGVETARPDEGGADARSELGGAITRVELDCGRGAATFYACAGEGGARLETSARIGGAREVGRVLAYEARTEGQRLSRELAILARDEVYERAVTAAATLIPKDDETK